MQTMSADPFTIAVDPDTGEVTAPDAITHTAHAAPSPLGRSLIDPAVLTAARAVDLAETIAVLIEEQRSRAIADADPEAIAAEAFEEAFDHSGKPRAPYLSHGLLVCPGGKNIKSKTSHDCTFVAVGDTWVWDSADVLYDDLRQQPGSRWMQAITILAPYEGLEFDQVDSRSRSGGKCQMINARSYTIRNGAIVATQVRARSASGHR